LADIWTNSGLIQQNNFKYMYQMVMNFHPDNLMLTSNILPQGL